MGFDFHNSKGGYFRFNWSAWPAVFELAQMYGWIPAGTEPPDGIPEGVDVMYFDMSDAQVIRNIEAPDKGSADDSCPNEPWAGGYFSNDWQYVTEAHALALAAALGRAMPELLDEDSQILNKEKVVGGYGHESEDDAKKDPKLCWSGPSSKARVQKFIDFCKQGRFAIG